MKIAIIGSRNLFVDINTIEKYIPDNVTEIVTGGAKGIDKSAEIYASHKAITLTEFLPDYSRYKKGAPLKRNELIADYADAAIAFWDGHSKGTLHTINAFNKQNKRVTVVLL